MKLKLKLTGEELISQLKNLALVIVGTLVLAFGCAIFVVANIPLDPYVGHVKAGTGSTDIIEKITDGAVALVVKPKSSAALYLSRLRKLSLQESAKNVTPPLGRQSDLHMIALVGIGNRCASEEHAAQKFTLTGGAPKSGSRMDHHTLTQIQFL